MKRSPAKKAYDQGFAKIDRSHIFASRAMAALNSGDLVTAIRQAHAAAKLDPNWQGFYEQLSFALRAKHEAEKVA